MYHRWWAAVAIKVDSHGGANSQHETYKNIHHQP